MKEKDLGMQKVKSWADKTANFAKNKLFHGSSDQTTGKVNNEVIEEEDKEDESTQNLVNQISNEYRESFLKE